MLIAYLPTSTSFEISQAITNAVASAGLGLNPRVLSNGRVDMGILQSNQVDVLNSGLTTSRGVMGDGETFTVSNGTTTITFEFDNVDSSNQLTNPNNVPILFRNNSTPESVVDTMKAVIEGTGLGLTTTVLPSGVLQLNDTPRFVYDTATSPGLRRTGVPGGAKPVSFIQDQSFDSAQVKKAIIAAINASSDTTLEAKSEVAIRCSSRTQWPLVPR